MEKTTNTGPTNVTLSFNDTLRVRENLEEYTNDCKCELIRLRDGMN